jgi:hypothetical protein
MVDRLSKNMPAPPPQAVRDIVFPMLCHETDPARLACSRLQIPDPLWHAQCQQNYLHLLYLPRNLHPSTSVLTIRNSATVPDFVSAHPK